MASIVTKKRKSGITYYISYRIPDEAGKPVQKWVRCGDKKEAYYLLGDVAAAEDAGVEYLRPTPPVVYLPEVTTTVGITVAKMLMQYVESHGLKNRQPSTLHTNRHIIASYIVPFIGSAVIATVTPRYLQQYYDDLPNHKAKSGGNHKTPPPNISPRTVKEVHKILRPAFDMAARLGDEISANPTLPLRLPKQPKYKREQWAEGEVTQALDACDDQLLLLTLSLMFGCTLRSGELAAITWDCVNISDEAVNKNAASVYIDKTLERLYRADIEATGGRDILFTFPTMKGVTKTVAVLKSPKNETSVRTIFLPNFIVELLKRHRDVQQQQKEFLDSEYHDYGLVIAQANGSPCQPKDLSKRFKVFLRQHNLRPVDFYSLRHAGATAKLRASGNIKAVQGDMGHATAEMLTRVYAAIVDEDRQSNAIQMEDRVFSKVKKST